jgi:hypothetical protein
MSALSYGRNQSDSFWPEPGGMRVFCILLGIFNASMWGILFYQVVCK